MPDDSRPLSHAERLIQRAASALGRLQAEQRLHGLTPSSNPAAAYARFTQIDISPELRAAIDAALTAEFPQLQRLRERIAAERFDDDDEWALLSHTERMRARFAQWLVEHGTLGEWRE